MAARTEPVLRQLIFEARYERGYRYLDRCGDIMLILEALLTDQTGCLWMAGEASPASAHLKSPDLDMTLTFGPSRMILDRNPVTDVNCDFAALADDILATLKARLDLRELNRLGSRRVKLVPTDSIDEAQQLSLRLCPVSEWRTTGSSSLVPREFEYTGNFETPDRMKGVRIIVKPFAAITTELKVDERLRLLPHHLPEGQRSALVEQLKRAKQRWKDPEAGVVVDIDYYWMWPSESTSIRDFLNEANEEVSRLEGDLKERPKR